MWRGEGLLSRDRKMPARIEKSTFHRILAMRRRYVKWVEVSGSTVDRTRGGQGRKEWGRICSGILLLWRLSGNAPMLGLAFTFSAV